MTQVQGEHCEKVSVGCRSILQRTSRVEFASRAVDSGIESFSTPRGRLGSGSSVNNQ